MSHEAATASDIAIRRLTLGSQLRKTWSAPVTPGTVYEPVQGRSEYWSTRCSWSAASAVTGLKVEPGG